MQVTRNKFTERQFSNELQSSLKIDRIGKEIKKPELENPGQHLENNSVVPDIVRTDNFTISKSPNSDKEYGYFVSQSRFIKNNICEAAFWLMANHPNAYLLLNLIAMRAQRTSNHPSGIQIGEALLGDYEAAGLTRRQYRTALDVLTRLKYITICETCRTRKKTTIGTTTKGTKVKLLSSEIWDINFDEDGHRNDHRAATDRPPTGHEQEVLVSIPSYSIPRERTTTNVRTSSEVVVVSSEITEEEKKSSIAIKEFADRAAKNWGKNWGMSLEFIEKTVCEYGAMYTKEQYTYMTKKHSEYMKIKDNPFKAGKEKGIDKPESYLEFACKNNYAKSINRKKKEI